MPKTLNPKPLEAEAESVPSSLRIVCDDAATITLAAADPPVEDKGSPDSPGDDGSPALDT